MDIIIKYHGDLPGWEVEDLGFGFGIVQTDLETAAALAALPQVEDVELPRELSPTVLTGESSLCLRALRSPLGPGLFGKGTAVGIVDTGVQYTHPAFRHADGSTRILSFWDRTVSPGGREYSAEEINRALFSEDPFAVLPPTDRSGHGTAVAGIAAGGEEGHFGVAPEASLIVVRVGNASGEYALSTELMRGMKFAVEKARSFGLPLSLNLSYGMNEGSHQGDSLFEEYINALSSVWKTVFCVPTGNEGGAGHHFKGTIRTGETMDVSFFTAEGISRCYLSLWKNFSDRFSCSLLLPGGQDTGTLREDLPPIQGTFGGVRLTGTFSGPTRYRVSQEVFYGWEGIGESRLIPPGLWTLRLRAGDIVDGTFHIYLPTVEQVTTGTFFTEPDPYDTMTIPSTARRVIKTGALNSRLFAAADFTGTGSTDGVLLPDVAAPGVSVEAPSLRGGYDAFTGTSFASPYTAGAASLLMEWGIVRGNDPFLYGERLKAFLQRSAARRNGFSYPNEIVGYGDLCPSVEP